MLDDSNSSVAPATNFVKATAKGQLFYLLVNLVCYNHLSSSFVHIITSLEFLIQILHLQYSALYIYI